MELTRYEAAELIADALMVDRGSGARTYMAKVWTAGTQVRVYVTLLGKKSKQAGYVEVLGDGSLNFNAVSLGKGDVRSVAEAALEGVTVVSVEVPANPPVRDHHDEDVRQHEASAAVLARSERE